MDIELFRGDTKVIELAVTANGAALDLTGKSLRFTVKASHSEKTALIAKSEADGIVVTYAAGGLAELTLLPEDTRSLANQVHTLVYDVRLVDGSNVYTVLDGMLYVRPIVGEIGP